MSSNSFPFVPPSISGPSSGIVGNGGKSNTTKAYEDYDDTKLSNEVEKHSNIYISNSSIRDKITQFHQGKYTEKYIKTYLDFVLMEGLISNLVYLEYLKDINGKDNAQSS